MSPLRKMLEVVGFGIDPKAPDGTAVTFEYTEVFVCDEMCGHVAYGRNHEAIILTPRTTCQRRCCGRWGPWTPPTSRALRK